MTPPTIVWFRQDLRLTDNPALMAAVEAGGPVVCVYIRECGHERWAPGGAGRWWLHHSLIALGRMLAAKGNTLVLRAGDAQTELLKLAAETGARAVHWNRCYEPAAIARDAAIKTRLAGVGIEAKSFNSALLFEPWTVKTQSGGSFRVFAPFWKSCRTGASPAEPLPAPKTIAALPDAPKSEALASWSLLPSKPDWATGLRATWTPGEAGALARLETFLASAWSRYPDERNRPDLPSTSMLSPHLHWGELSPRTLWHAVQFAQARRPELSGAAEKFLSEIGWREFSYHLLFHAPHLPEKSLRGEFEDFPWANDERAFAAWTCGQTGYPIVDAGMRELWQTGWMHNRVRMIVASFLVKHLLIPWQRGAAWFWDTLVDADLANNSASWQWVAGCGADAAPYFRIFNPVLQGERFDPNGDYVRRFVPELGRLPNEFIQRPWTANAAMLRDAGVRLGETYPHPLVDHAAGRNRALAAFRSLKRDAA